MRNDPLTEIRMQIMKAADLLVIAIIVMVFAMSMLANITIDSFVQVLRTSDLSVFGQQLVFFDASTVKAYLSMTTLFLSVMSLVYWGIRKLGTQFGQGWHVVALTWFLVIALFSVPSGISHWLLVAFDPYQFAPARFIDFLVELSPVLHPNGKSETGWWTIIALKSGVAIALPTIYLSTFWRPLKSVKSVRIN